jgi:Tfp pilus assembly protein PilW
MMKARRPLTRSHGFSYVEGMIASALFAPIVIVVLLVIETMHSAYGKGEQSADLQQSARIAMARIVRELRAAGLDPSGILPQLAAQSAVQTAELNRIAFIADANDDGNTEKIEYRLDQSGQSPVLRRQQWSAWNSGWTGTNGGQPLAERITSVEFAYFGPGDGTIPLSDLPARMAEIRRVRVTIMAENYRLVSDVRLRNVGL